jgi:hypothetical protein
MWRAIIFLERKGFMNLRKLHSGEPIEVLDPVLWYDLSNWNIIGGGYYTLRDIIFFLENADLSISEHRSKVIEAGVTAVVVQDRGDLKKYLTGEIDHCDQIDLTLTTSTAAESTEADLSLQESVGATLADGAMEDQRRKYADILERNAKSSWTFRLATLSII